MLASSLLVVRLFENERGRYRRTRDCICCRKKIVELISVAVMVAIRSWEHYLRFLCMERSCLYKILWSEIESKNWAGWWKRWRNERDWPEAVRSAVAGKSSVKESVKHLQQE